MKTSAFFKISFSQIKALLEVITESKERDFDFIKKNYETRGVNFHETLLFLEQLQVVQSHERGLVISDASINKNLEFTMLKTILEGKGNASDEFCEYLGYYWNSDKDFEYAPASAEENIHRSDVRNFCMNMGLVHHEERNGRDIYILNREYTSFLSNYFKFNPPITKKQLMERLKKQERIGWDAEKRVLEYENAGLSGTGLKAEIISENNVTAGYDIESWSIQPSSEPSRKFIEVKAVSSVTYEFHWTRNEIEKSRELGKQYFLYLLPVSKDEQFDVASMKQISNPYKKIFELKKGWTIQEDSYTVEMK